MEEHLEELELAERVAVDWERTECSGECVGCWFVENCYGPEMEWDYGACYCMTCGSTMGGICIECGGDWNPEGGKTLNEYQEYLEVLKGLDFEMADIAEILDDGNGSYGVELNDGTIVSLTEEQFETVGEEHYIWRHESGAYLEG